MYLLFSACANPQKMVYKGQYDEAFYHCANKLSKTTKRKTKLVAPMHEAYKKAQERDLNNINRLRTENNDANWTIINDTYKKITARQERIRALTPLRDEDGKTYDVSYIDVNQGAAEAQQKAADFHYKRGLQFLQQAEPKGAGYIKIARDAVLEFEALKKINSNYKDTEVLLQKASDLASVQILFTLSDNSNSGQRFNTKTAVDSLLKSVASADRWTKIDQQAQSAVQYEYDLIFIATKIYIAPVINKQISHQRRTSVDTTINNARQTISVEASVIHHENRQNCQIEGTWQVIDKANNQTLCNVPIAYTWLYIQTSATFTGDRRALSAEDDQYTRTNTQMPSREQLIYRLFARTGEEIQSKCSWRKP